jgi:hypothetical protein
MVPFQSDINRSSPSSRPYEHASGESQALDQRSMASRPTSTETFLALLQLLQQSEVPGDFGAHVWVGEAVKREDGLAVDT